MITARDLARKLKVEDSSVVRAIQELAQFEFDDKTYLKHIADLRGISHDLEPLEDRRLTKYAFRYLVQDLMTSELAGLPQNPDSVYLNAVIKARKYIDNNPWVFAEKEVEVKLDAMGNVAPKKGDKKVMAKEWYDTNKARIMALPKDQQRKTAIAELVKEIGLTEAGASTYWANLKAGKY